MMNSIKPRTRLALLNALFLRPRLWWRSIFASCLALSFSFPAHGGENRDLEPQRLKLAASIHAVLVKGGECETPDDCRRKQKLFVSPSKTGLCVTLYSIRSPKVLAQVVGVFMEEVSQMKRHVRCCLIANEGSKADEMARSFWQSTDYVLKIEMNGGL